MKCPDCDVEMYVLGDKDSIARCYCCPECGLQLWIRKMSGSLKGKYMKVYDDAKKERITEEIDTIEIDTIDRRTDAEVRADMEREGRMIYILRCTVCNEWIGHIRGAKIVVTRPLDEGGWELKCRKCQEGSVRK